MARNESFRLGTRLCENSEVGLARRTFVSNKLNKKRTALSGASKKAKRENNSARLLLVDVFTQPGSKGEILAASLCFPLYLRKRTSDARAGGPLRALNGSRHSPQLNRPRDPEATLRVSSRRQRHDEARLFQRTRKASLPRKWRDSLTLCAATASLSL